LKRYSVLLLIFVKGANLYEHAVSLVFRCEIKIIELGARIAV